jgi:hypothetical protein
MTALRFPVPPAHFSAWGRQAGSAKGHLTKVALLCSLAACAPTDRFDDFPTMDAPAGYPALQPIDALLAQADAASSDTGPAVTARAARLKARAAGLGAP